MDVYFIILGLFILVVGLVSDVYGCIMVLCVGLIVFGVVLLVVVVVFGVEFLIVVCVV